MSQVTPRFIPSSELYALLVQRMDNMVQRPDMYAPNPEGLENALFLLDGFTRDLTQTDQHTQGLTAFLATQGFGSAGICSRSILDGENLSQSDLFKRVVQIWKDYRNSPFAAHLNFPVTDLESLPG